MKKASIRFPAWIMVLCLAMAVSAFAEEKFPVRQGLINDFAGVIPADTKREMDTRAREVLQKTGTSLLVATVPTIGENYLQGYVNDLYRHWGIGKKGENKGVLIFVAVKERKVRIETGYGVEGILPDGKVGEIIRNDMAPFLKKGDYGTGLLNAIKSVSQIIAADAKVTLTGQASIPAKTVTKTGGIGTTVIVIIVLVTLGIIGLIIWAIRRFGGRSGDSGDSGDRYTSYGSSSGYSGSSSSSSDSSSDSGSCGGGDSGGGGSDSDY